MYILKVVASLLFVLMAPILCGALLPVFALKLLGEVWGGIIMASYVVYMVVYFWFWSEILDEGRKLTL